MGHTKVVVYAPEPIEAHPDRKMHDGTWTLLCRQIFEKRRLTVEPWCRGFKQSCIIFPCHRDILLAQDLIADITIHSPISFIRSTLYSKRNTTFFMTNSLVTCLQVISNVCYRAGPAYISPSREWKNRSLDTCFLASTLRDTWNALLWSPIYEVTVDLPNILFW
jgi:hypothetical protein